MSAYDRISSIFPLDQGRKKKKGNEPRVIFLTFLGVLIPSALLLTLPVFSVTGLSVTDALFTATSAISVTGLGVVDAGKHFTTEGQVLLMFLMQVGGLGQMTLSAVLLYMFGVRLSLKQQALAKESLGQGSGADIHSLVNQIVIFAFATEFVGFVLLSIHFVPQMGWETGMFYALFHSISAFNNAGFSLFSNNMMGYVNDPITTSSAGWVKCPRSTVLKPAVRALAD